MLPASETVKKILHDSSKAEELAGEFETTLPERYKRFVMEFIERRDDKKPRRFRTILLTIELGLGAIGASLGFFIIYSGAAKEVELVVWSSYIFLVVIVGLTTRLIPDDAQQYYLEASKIRLINLAERLAAEVALFGLIDQPVVDDDESVIQKISDKVPAIESMDMDVQTKVLACQDSSKVFFDPRETNVLIKELNISGEAASHLQNSIRQIVELCGHLFAGRDFSAKLYLRSVKEFNGKKIESLVSFAKFPVDAQGPRGTYGSSWIKARGNPSIVWDCLEKGRPIHGTQKDFSSFTAYYSSVLAICLPGRIGVLSLTANQENAFKDKDDDWVVKSLAVPTRTVILKILGINE